MQKSVISFTIAVLLLSSIRASGDVIRVPADQPTIQEGIDAATDGDTVLVSDGIYSGPWNIRLDYKGKSITVKSENGPESCVIDCEQMGRAAYFHHSETRQSRLEGMTIRNGYEYAAAGSDNPPDLLTKTGLASKAPRDPEPTVTPTPAPYGGGGVACYHASPSIVGCVFENNWTYGVGGGIGCSDNSGPLILNCTFTGNHSPTGGGVGCINTSGSPVIALCTIINNISSNLGGGLYFTRSPVRVYDCVIQENSARHSGGGVYGDITGFEMYNCSVSGNSVTNDSIYTYGGGLHITSNSTKLVNCIITGNTCPGYGGGLSLSSARSLSLRSCTVAGNHAAVSGGALFGAHSDYSMVDSILWGNEPDEIANSNSEGSITYSIVAGGFEGEGNLDSDPLFAEGPLGDYYLSEIESGQQADSPAVDAGSEESELVCTKHYDRTECFNNLTTRTDHQPDGNRINLGYHYSPDSPAPVFTPTPVPVISQTPTPLNPATPTPEPSDYHLDLILSREIFHRGDQFLLEVEVTKSGSGHPDLLCLAVLLDVDSQYFWYPRWTESFQCEMIRWPEGDFFSETILKFIWPEIEGSHEGVFFYAALVGSGGITGNWDYEVFGWD